LDATISFLERAGDPRIFILERENHTTGSQPKTKEKKKREENKQTKEKKGKGLQESKRARSDTSHEAI
jgi:hypothetical protein